MNPKKISVLCIVFTGILLTLFLVVVQTSQPTSPESDVHSAEVNAERLARHIEDDLNIMQEALSNLSYNTFWQSSPVAEWSFWLNSQQGIYSAAGISQLGVHAMGNDVMYFDKPSLPGQYSELKSAIQRTYESAAPVDVLQNYRGKPAVISLVPIKNIEKQPIGSLVAIRFLDNEKLKTYHVMTRVPVALISNDQIQSISIETSPALSDYKLVQVSWPSQINSALWQLVLLVQPAPAVPLAAVWAGVGLLLTLILAWIVAGQFNNMQRSTGELIGALDLQLPINEQISRLTNLQNQSKDENIAEICREFRLRLEQFVQQKRSMSLEVKKLQQSELELRGQIQSLRSERDSAFNAPKLKSEFLSRMGDEITTPMKSVVSMLKLLSEYQFEEEPKQLLNIAKRSTRTLVDNLNNILDFSKLDAGMLKLHSKAFSVRELVDDLSAELSHYANDKGLSLQASSNPEVPGQVNADVNRIKQILRNLLGNAIRFTKSGEVSLYADTLQQGDSTMLRFTISDSGVGIPPDAQKGLFDSLEQSTKLTNSSFAGRLRLIVSKHLSELMGGEIGVISEVGKGSQFWFTVAI